MPTDAQRRAVDEDLVDPIMSIGLDHEIAADHGVSAEYVRERRRQRRQDLFAGEVHQRLVELAKLHDWPGTPLELLLHLLDGARLRVIERRGRHPIQRMQELREALLEDNRRRELARLGSRGRRAAGAP